MAGRAIRRPGTVASLTLHQVDDPATQRAFDQTQDAVQNAQALLRRQALRVAALEGSVTPSTLLSVADFGAAGDGVTDDTLAIQTAIDAAEGEQAIVYIPSGVHIISDTLFIPSKVILTGIGRDDGGKIKASALFSTDGRPLVRLGRATDTLIFGCRVENVILDANSRAGTVVYTTCANEQSGVKYCVLTNFTQYGIHFDSSSGVIVEDCEVYPQTAGATTGVFFNNVALDNLMKRVTLGVQGQLTNGLHVLSSQLTAMNIHVETCTNGINLGGGATCVLIGVSGPSVNPDVTDLVIDQGVNHHVGMNLVKNAATRVLRSLATGFSSTAAFLPLWVGGDAAIMGSLGFYGAAVQTKQTVTGSRGGNAALASLLTALATYGLITDGTTA